MRLKNILLVVDDIEKSIVFYKEIFGLQVLKHFDGNVILTEGLVLQDRKIWESLIGQKVSCGSNASELYFVENNLEEFQKKLEESSFEIEYVHKLKEYDWGQKAIRIYDLDGHMIEIGETASV
jgi:catechol 2,3-dioxygenase-like lactoylglutathione lyase family enzyme